MNRFFWGFTAGVVTSLVVSFLMSAESPLDTEAMAAKFTKALEDGQKVRAEHEQALWDEFQQRQQGTYQKPKPQVAKSPLSVNVPYYS